MNVEKLIRMLLELDQTYESPRPSPWGLAAQLVQDLASHAEGSLRNSDVFGNYWSVDMSLINKPISEARSQPLLSELWEGQRADRPQTQETPTKNENKTLVIPIKFNTDEALAQLTELHDKVLVIKEELLRIGQ